MHVESNPIPNINHAHLVWWWVGIMVSPHTTALQTQAHHQRTNGTKRHYFNAFTVTFSFVYYHSPVELFTALISDCRLVQLCTNVRKQSSTLIYNSRHITYTSSTLHQRQEATYLHHHCAINFGRLSRLCRGGTHSQCAARLLVWLDRAIYLFRQTLIHLRSSLCELLSAHIVPNVTHQWLKTWFTASGTLKGSCRTATTIRTKVSPITWTAHTLKDTSKHWFALYVLLMRHLPINTPNDDSLASVTDVDRHFFASEM